MEATSLIKNVDDLLRAVRILDGAMVFMLKRKVALRIEALDQVVKSLCRGQTILPTLDLIRMLCSALPQTIEMAYVPEREEDATLLKREEPVEPWSIVDSGVTFHLEVVLKEKFNQISKKKCEIRVKAFEQAIQKNPNVRLHPLPKIAGSTNNFTSSHEIIQDSDINPITSSLQSSSPKQTSSSSERIPSNSSNSHENHSSSSSRANKFDIDGLVCRLKEMPFYKDQLVHLSETASREKKTAKLQHELHPSLEKALNQDLGIKDFFLHQATAIDASLDGKDVIVATATSSGKSLIFNIPIFQTFLNSSVNMLGSNETDHAFYVNRSVRPVTAFYIFPTKALAQDQLGSTTKLADAIFKYSGVAPRIRTLDGDTPEIERSTIRDSADIIITNPDMLHVTILPGFRFWGSFLSSLRYVVIDEAHTYHGAFGSHVSCVLRRLLRIASFFSSKPQFFCCSATIGNPETLFTNLIGSFSSNQVKFVGDALDGSACGRRVFGIWNPPYSSVKKKEETNSLLESSSTSLSVVPIGDNPSKTEVFLGEHNSIDTSVELSHDTLDISASSKIEKATSTPTSDSRRKSAIFETALLLSTLVRCGVKTIAFCRTRKLTELVLRYTIEELENGYKGKIYDNKSRILAGPAPHLVPLVAAYRGGYQLDERRILEQKLFNGNLLAVTATCALELGIDVGHLDCVLLLGYPGSASSLWQQVGRAGRSGKDALALFVCFDGPLEQYFCKFPKMLLDRARVEDAVLDPNNKYAVKDHLLCSLKELPMNDNDVELFGSSVALKALEELITDGLVVKQPQIDGSNLYQAHEKIQWPARNVSLRTIDPVSFELYHENHLLDSIPYSRSLFELYPGAIYMHQGQSFLVTKLDLNTYKAYAHPTHVQYYTSPRDSTTVNILNRFESVQINNSEESSFQVHCGHVEVVSRVWGYRKMWLRNGRVFEMHEFTLPNIHFETQATWIDICSSVSEDIHKQGLNLRAGIHVLNHLLCKLVPLFVVCSSSSVATEHTGEHFKRPQPPRLLLYDRIPGGIGVSESAFLHMHELLRKCADLLFACECNAGCPSCFIDSSCSEHNAVLDKSSAKALIKGMLGNQLNRTAASDSISSEKRKLPTTPQRERAKAVRRAMGLGRARFEQIQIERQWNEQLPNHSEGMK